MSIDKFVGCMEDCYCAEKVINISQEDEDGTSSVNTDMVQVYRNEEYIYFEDDRDTTLKIKIINIKSIISKITDFCEELILTTKIKTYTFMIMG